MKTHPEQLLTLVEDLKSRLNADSNGTASPSSHQRHVKPGTLQKPGTNDAWLLRQQLQDTCHDLMIANGGSGAEIAVGKRIEQDLWNYAFRQQITLLESQLEKQQQDDVSAAHLAATRTSLQYFLELASGFYIQLMEEIALLAGLDVPLFRGRDHFGVMSHSSMSSSSSPTSPGKPESSTTISRSIALYLVQHCLVHLGDLARYMAKLSPGESHNDSSSSTLDHLDIAQHYYVAAAILVPFSGQPFNQLAIVEAQQGNRLGAAYLYARALSARSPFPAAEQNLTRLLERIFASSSLVKDKQASMVAPKSIAELVAVCIQLLATSWLKPSESSSRVSAIILGHLGNATQSFLSDRVGATFSWFQLVQLAFLNAFIVSRRHNTPQGRSALSFIVLFLNHLVRELTSIAKSDNSGGVCFGRSPLLPATRLIISFFASNANVLLSNATTETNDFAITDIKSPHLWHSVAKLAEVASAAALKSSLPYSTPLPEDVELKGCSMFSETFASLAMNKSSESNLGGISPFERAGSSTGEATLDFDYPGPLPSYNSSANSASSAATAFLACARFSESCSRLATAAPHLLKVVSTEPYTCFICPIHIPINPISLFNAVAMSSAVPIANTQGSNVTMSQSFLIKPNETAPSDSMNKLPQNSTLGQSSSPSPITTAAANNSSDRPRNVVFQSIVHTMRSRPQPAAPAVTSGNTVTPQHQQLPSGSSSNTNSAVGSPRLVHQQRFNRDRDQPNSGTNTPRNVEELDPRGSNSAPHRNLPPRLARLAEAEASSRVSKESPRNVLPIQVNLSSSNSSSSSSVSNTSNRPQTSQLQQNIPHSFAKSQQPSLGMLGSRSGHIESGILGSANDRFADFSDRRVIGQQQQQQQQSAFIKPSASAFQSVPKNHATGGNAASNTNNSSHLGNLAAPVVDDGWTVLSSLRPRVTDSGESSLIKNNPPASLKSDFTGADFPERSRIPGDYRTQPEQSSGFSLFGSNKDEEGNWPFSLASAQISSAMRSMQSDSGRDNLTGSSNQQLQRQNSGWSPMLSAAASAAMAQQQQQQRQPQERPNVLDSDSIFSALTAGSSNTNRNQQFPSKQEKNSILGNFGTDLRSGQQSNAAQDGPDFGGWSQLQSSGISPSKLWSAFGFDLTKSNPAGAPPTPPN